MKSESNHNHRQEEMLQLIEAYHKSGQNQQQFCIDHNLHKSTFYYWLKKFRQNKSKTKEFIPLTVTPPNHPDSDYCIELPNRVKIHLSGSAGLELIANFISKTLNSHAAC